MLLLVVVVLNINLKIVEIIISFISTGNKDTFCKKKTLN